MLGKEESDGLHESLCKVRRTLWYGRIRLDFRVSSQFPLTLVGRMRDTCAEND
jgi:hypothetical protein